ncbi:MAG: T9SS type A sorting domain-containing protein [Bacteroidota bacterium]|nr:T9SS type A sorting domain-containing protein [Bacteroidota bacterium]
MKQSQIILLIILLSMRSNIYGQVVLQKAPIPIVGNKFNFSITNNPSSFDYGNFGTNQRFDFSKLIAQNSTMFNIVDFNSSPDKDLFPEANVAIHRNQGGETYYRMTDSSISYIGLAFEISTQNGSFHVNKETRQINFPFLYQSSFYDSSLIDITIPDTVYKQYDSLRYRQKIVNHVIADAWGKMITKQDSFDVLRLRTDYENLYFTEEYKNNTGQWAMLQSNQKSSGTYYDFWTTGFILPVASVYVDKLGEAAGVVWLANYNLPAPQISPSTNLTIYPNSSSGIFTISYNTTVVQKSELYIYNMQGEKVHEETWNNPATKTLDLSFLSKGMYIIKLAGETQKILID